MFLFLISIRRFGGVGAQEGRESARPHFSANQKNLCFWWKIMESTGFSAKLCFWWKSMDTTRIEFFRQIREKGVANL
jgi:hypothetical protein